MHPTHISKEIDEISIVLAAGIPITTKDLKNENTEAEYIRFDWEETLASIRRRHVATEMKHIVYVKLL